MGRKELASGDCKLENLYATVVKETSRGEEKMEVILQLHEEYYILEDKALIFHTAYKTML